MSTPFVPAKGRSVLYLQGANLNLKPGDALLVVDKALDRPPAVRIIGPVYDGSLVYQIEKTIKQSGDKLKDSDKQALESGAEPERSWVQTK